MSKYQLGKKATVKSSGLQGVITGQSNDIKGRVQYNINHAEDTWYDEELLEIEDTTEPVLAKNHEGEGIE